MKKVALVLALSSILSAQADNVLISASGTSLADTSQAKDTVAIGNQQLILNEQKSVIIGDNACAQFGCLATNGVAIGYNTTTRTNSVAIGAEANAFGTNSGQIMGGRNFNDGTVQVGSGYITDKKGFANSGVKNAQSLVVNGDVFTSGIIQAHGGDMMGGKIVNVAAGVADTDAVNVSQLKEVEAGAKSYTDNSVNNAVTTLNQTITEGDANTLNQANTYTDSKVSNVVNNYAADSRSYADNKYQQAIAHTESRFSQAKKNTNRVGAMAMAMGSFVHDQNHVNSVSASVGHYEGETAVAAQFARRINERLRAGASVGYDGKNVGFGVSATYGW